MRNQYLLLVLLPVITVLITASNPFPVYTKADLLGEINPSSHPDFVKVANRYTNKTTYLRKETYAAFLKMRKAASKDGINLKIVSGTRNKSRQTEIWNRKWNRLSGTKVERARTILQYSSMPGTSRHHWGTDLDFNSVEPSYFEQGKGAEIYNWLSENAEKFGFFQPYIPYGKHRTAGYREEKWHWSYYPTANQLIMAYKRMINYTDITGFKGAEIAEELDIINQFVQGIPDINLRYNGFYNPEQ